MTHAVEIRRLTKAFDGQIPALGPLSLDLAAGSATAVIGRSGCGKTTLLRCLGGIEAPSDGSIRFGASVSASDIGYVFQEPRLMPWLDVRRNVGFGLSRLAPAARAAAVDEALQVVGLAHAGHLLPKQLSGGMAQRVALARGLASRPSLLLLDEPFSALDPLTRETMQVYLSDIRAHYRPTLVLVTHDLEEAIALADRVVVLHGPPGRIVADLAIDLAAPRARPEAAFQAWRRRLTELLAQAATERV